jgi:hypothetical protein
VFTAGLADFAPSSCGSQFFGAFGTTCCKLGNDNRTAEYRNSFIPDLQMEYDLRDTSPTDARLYGSGSTEEYTKILSLFKNQGICVKTVGNGDWPALIQKCRCGTNKTPTTVLPPGGKNMRLYGKPQFLFVASCITF